MASWETFYVIVGSAGAALIGIQFVVVTLIANMRRRPPAEALNAFGTPTVVHLMALADQTMRSLKGSTMQRPLFDALIVRMALSEQFTSIRELLANAEKAPPLSNPQIAGQKKK